MQKVGILGGGQLGRMLLQQAANYPVETFVMENDEGCPAAHLCHHFIKGDIRNFDDVYRFGKELDTITIEIESVNTEALEKLEQEGKRIIPNTAALRIIQDKILQKQFYHDKEIPTSDFVVVQNRAELKKNTSLIPAVQKLAQGGYDGRGVMLINSENEMDTGFDKPSVLEKKVNIRKEIAVIIGINDSGQTAVFPPVEMIFDPVYNLLDFQICPSELAEHILWRVEAIALKVVKKLKSPGIFAVELFVDERGVVLVNETAPRVHNSGHHTIEANCSSQYDMLWRIILGYPMGNTEMIKPSVLVNLVGEKGHSGPVTYQGIQDLLNIPNAYIHLYGKRETRPGRKMGHVTLTGDDKTDLMRKAAHLKKILKVVSGPR
jgi:5-(carboxyamino)imidazole ribonucleotide synthase